MAEYMALRIISGMLDYCYVIGKRPDLEGCINASLINKNRTDLIRVCEV